MLHCSWDMVHDRCNYLFWAFFWPFTPLTAQKTKILKKWKTCLEILSFYICVPKIMIIWYVADVIVISHIGLFFALLPPPECLKIQDFEKIKKTLVISSFYIFVPKIMIRWFTVPVIWCMTDVIVQGLI